MYKCILTSQHIFLPQSIEMMKNHVKNTVILPHLHACNIFCNNYRKRKWDTIQSAQQDSRISASRVFIHSGFAKPLSNCGTQSNFKIKCLTQRWANIYLNSFFSWYWSNLKLKLNICVVHMLVRKELEKTMLVRPLDHFSLSVHYSYFVAHIANWHFQVSKTCHKVVSNNCFVSES